MPTSHILRCSHSPVKVLNQWEKEVPSNRIELVWAGSQFHMRLTLSKRKMKSRHKMQHPALPLHWTLSRLQIPCSQPIVNRCLYTYDDQFPDWIVHFSLQIFSTSKHFNTI